MKPSASSLVWHILLVVLLVAGFGLLFFKINSDTTGIKTDVASLKTDSAALSGKIGAMEEKIGKIEAEATKKAAEEVGNSETTTNIFDPVTVKVGDKVGDLTVSSTKALIATGPALAEDFSIDFMGEVTIQGEYDYDMNAMFGQEGVCFNVTDAFDRNKIPVPNFQKKLTSSFFCTYAEDDVNLIKSIIGTSYKKGTALMTIKNFNFSYAPTETAPTANIVKFKELVP